jgi:hypothetical protein
MANEGEYLRRLREGEIHGEKLRFEWSWVGRLRGGERAATFAGEEGGSEGGGQLGAGRETLNLKCFATLSGEAGSCASPLPMAKH